VARLANTLSYELVRAEAEAATRSKNLVTLRQAIKLSRTQSRRSSPPESRCAKVTSRMEFVESTPTAMIALNASNEQHQDNAAAGAGKREDDDERIEEALIVHHERIDEYRRKHHDTTVFSCI
jgi:hypothetical protein